MDKVEEIILETYKIIILGNTQVGKTSLLIRYSEGEYKQTRTTIAIDFRIKKVNYKGIDLKLELWDSAGHERYRTIVYNYFTFAKAAVIVFDLTNQDSLMHARDWLQQFVNHSGDEIPKILLGNKSDLVNLQEIQEKMLKYRMRILEMKKELDFEFFVVSAKTGAGVEEAFSFLLAKMYAFSKRVQVLTTKDSVFKLNASIVGQNKSTRDSLYKNKCC